MSDVTHPVRAGAQKLSLLLIGILLLGYMLLDKGFAHLSIGSVYVGEIFLSAALLPFLFAPNVRPLVVRPQAWAVLALVAWCFYRTVPYLDDYGVDALRDAVLYGYSLFGMLVASYAAEKTTLEAIVVLFHRISGALMLFLLLGLLLIGSNPETASGETHWFSLKPGDVGVHLSGILAFALTGWRDRLLPRQRDPLWRKVSDAAFWAGWLALVAWSVTISRGALLAMVVSGLVAPVFGFGRRRLVVGAGILLVLMSLAGVASFKVERDRRDISLDQIIENTLSIVDPDSGSGDLESNTSWRLEWWNEIFNYTLYGDYFWTGKGFGINLFTDDRGEIAIDESLRSPHNGHLTFLARSGVPGVALWSVFLLSFIVALWRRAKALQAAGLPQWAAVNVWILSYWIAAVVNATFDVYLEGPQGGIWFWSLSGLGLAALTAEQTLVGKRAVVAGLFPLEDKAGRG